MKRMFGLFLVVGGLSLFGCSDGAAPNSPPPLITGKYIVQPTGPVQVVGNLPINMILSPDRKFAIVTDVGENESLWTIGTADDAGVSHVDYSNGRSPNAPLAGENMVAAATRLIANYGLFYGLAISADNTIYAAQGSAKRIAVLKMDDAGKLTASTDIDTPGIIPVGLALDDHNHLYVADNASDTGKPLDSPGGLYIYDTTTNKQLGRFLLTSKYGGTSNYALGITAKRDGTRAYVASERDGDVYVVDTHDASDPRLVTTITTGARPVALLLSSDESKLYVANSLSDTISIVDTANNQVSATVLLRPSMARDLPGATPIGLALSPDGKRLYAALGDMNAVAVVDPAVGQLLGYVPTQWYPTSLAVTPDGKKILVANGKGRDVRVPNNVKNPNDPLRNTTSILSVIEGNVTDVDLPASVSDLDKSTQEVLKENRLDELTSPKTNPLASIGLSSGNITHVVYIIKENRTYDQVMGDVKAGNGDPSLVLFGKDITPNQHALADRFVLFDNLYACGEVSGDGWVWSTQGMADAFVERTIPYHYSHRGRPYDYEGTNNNVPVAGTPDTDADGKPITVPANAKKTVPMPDVAGTGKYIWSLAHAAGLSMRNYGFFMTNESDQPPDNYPTVSELRPAGHDLAGITDIDYRRFDLNFADSDAPQMYATETGNNAYLYREATYGQANAPSRFTEWNREFQMMLKKDASGGAVPTLMMIRVPDDHTGGARSAQHTPKSMVADNDYAVGEIVQAISNSPIWKHTAIFIIEDDAQSGMDHVDAHRTTGFVISPWIKANSVDHNFYNTDSMLKTIELLLNLPPMAQYDAVADPIMDWDTAPNNAATYEASLPSRAVLAEVNPKASDLAADDPRLKMAQDSDAMDFTRADAAPADQLDEITWKTVKGPESSIPSRTRTKLDSGDRDDDD